MKKALFFLVLVSLAWGAVPLDVGETAPREQEACPPAGSGDWCSNWQSFEEGRRDKVCLDYAEMPEGWSHVIWYLRESGCQGSQCSSTWEPNRQQALQVEAETVWTPLVSSWEPVVLPFTQTLSVTVDLKYLTTYRGDR